MRAHPLPEARAYADLMLTELRKVIPSFLKRVDLPDRGVAWSNYLADDPRPMDEVARPAVPDARPSADEAPGASTLVDFDPDAEVKLVAAHALPLHRPARDRDRGPGAGHDRRRAAGGRAGLRAASGPTAATSPAGPSSAARTASTCWPTTAPSGTCSATAC